MNDKKKLNSLQKIKTKALGVKFKLSKKKATYCINETTENETEFCVILHKRMFMYVIFW